MSSAHSPDSSEWLTSCEPIREGRLVEVINARWRKSSHSGGGQNGSCVEVAFAGPSVAVRDSKAPHSGALVVSSEVWRSFLHYGRREE
jgi:hypothetical protein